MPHIAVIPCWSLPQELLELSLSAPGRVTLPRAPPHSLLLFNNQFSPFPAGWGLETPLVAKYTGDRLQLREGGQQMRQQFREQVGNRAGLTRLSGPTLDADSTHIVAAPLLYRTQVFNAAINDLLKHPDWELWSRRVLPRYLYAEEDVQPAVAQHREWYTELMAKREKAAEKAAAKAAAAAEAEAAAAAASQEQPLQKQGSWLEDGLKALAGMLGGSKS
jgi:tRNA pseudouridine38-40 synthase